MGEVIDVARWDPAFRDIGSGAAAMFEFGGLPPEYPAFLI
jgi:hypothetical protein